MPSTGPNPTDIYVGKRLRAARALKGLSQDQLGALVGITFQQIQKYERGINRVSASRLFDFAQVLDKEVAYFFDGCSSEGSNSISQNVSPELMDALDQRDIQKLVKCYISIREEHLRKAVLAFVTEVSSGRVEANTRQEQLINC